jgi:hypothetical protein
VCRYGTDAGVVGVRQGSSETEPGELHQPTRTLSGSVSWYSLIESCLEVRGNSSLAEVPAMRNQEKVAANY